MAPTKDHWEEHTDAGASGEVDEIAEDDDEFGGGATRIAPMPTPGSLTAPPKAAPPPPKAAAAPRAEAKVVPIKRDDKGAEKRAKLQSLSMSASPSPSSPPLEGAAGNLSKLKSLSLGAQPLPSVTTRAPTQGGGSFPLGRVITVGVVALVGVGLYVAWPRISGSLHTGADPGVAKPQMRFLVTELTTKPATTLTAAGHTTAETFTIGASVSGRVDAVLVTEGAVVKKKQILIQLDDSQIKADRRLAESKAANYRHLYNRQLAMLKAGAILPIEAEKSHGELMAAEAEVSTYTPKLQQMKILAPNDATVVEVLVHPGEVISTSAGATSGVIRLADLERPLIETDINEADVASLHIGDKVEATIESFPDAIFKGTLKSISSQADRTKGTFKVMATLAPDRRLRTNMSAKVRIQASATPDPKLFIPRDALKDGAVWVVVDGRAKRRPVTTGAAGGPQVEVTAGLKAGERIIVSGYEGVAEGDKIQVQ